MRDASRWYNKGLRESLVASNLSIYLAEKSDVLESIREIATTVI
jgi:hypothetical protein